MSTLMVSVLAASLTWTASAATPERFVSGAAHAAACAEADAVLAEMADTHALPGASAAVWADDGVAWFAGVGMADLELEAPVTGASRFRLGSVSKVLTASLAARLAERGFVDLDADVRTYVPSLPERTPPVTLRLLLGHRGGIRHYKGSDFDSSQPGGMIDLRLYPTTEDALALFAQDDLVATPGEKYAYSTFGYTLVAAALEGATGKPFLDLLAEHLWGPLGMTSTCADDMREIVPGRVSFYDAPNARLGEREAEGVRRALPLNAAYKWAGGGLVSTPADMARLGAAHFGPGFFEAATLEDMFTPQTSGAADSFEVGLGWRIGQDESGRRIVHHAGSMSGCRAVLVVWPAEGVAASVLTNLSGTPGDILGYAVRMARPFAPTATP